jgi:N-acylglucosamine 2-epimerase
MTTAEKTLERLEDPSSYTTAPYKVPRGAKAHGVSMIFSNVFHQLGSFTGDEKILQAAYEHTRQVMTQFRRPEMQCVLEYVAENGSMLDVPEGRAVCPGHAIESMWFQIHIFMDRDEPEHTAQAVECIRWHVDMAWDPLYGGLRLARDAETGDNPVWAFPDGKFWWVHTETLYALLLAYEQSEMQWCLDWYDDVHEWTFSHFPNPEHGEWKMRLQRDGREPDQPLVLTPMPVKDPFHTPRAFIYCIECLGRLTAEEQ